MKSWKTTALGALGAIGMYLSSVTEPSWMPFLGEIVTGVSILLMGYFTRDKNVSSEEQKA